MSSEFNDLMRDYLADRYPDETLRADIASETGYSIDLWQSMAAELGLPGLALPSHVGGSELSFVELGGVAQEMGKVLLCSPFFSTVVLAANALLLSGDSAAQHRFLPEIVSGKTTAAVVLAPTRGSAPSPGTSPTATHGARGWTIRGTTSHVIDGSTASLVLVFARSAAGLSLFAVDGEADGLTRTAIPTLDPTRRLAKVVFSETPATPIGELGSGDPVLSKLTDLAAVFLAAEQVGGIRRCLEMSVEHAKSRYQFGRPLGSFQAIKHKCADMLVGLEMAQSAADHAAQCCATGEDLPLAASMAKAYCSEAFVDAAGTALQIHGGLGFTWEHSIHLYLKRARSSAVLFGSPGWHRKRVGGLLGLTSGTHETRRETPSAD